MVKSKTNIHGQISFSQLQRMLSDLEAPTTVVDAQRDNVLDNVPSNNELSESRKERQPRVRLFFSFDIVNSTMYKAFTGNWPIVIRGLLKGILKNVYKSDELGSCILWRVIGDEMVFVLPIQAKNEILPAIDAIFEVTQRISFSLKSGKFYDTLENQSLRMEELNVLKTQNTLSIKSAAWIAVVNEEFKSPYDNVTFDYSASSNNQTLREYLGKDIDAGFRLKEYTQDRRLAISFELAYLIQKISGNNNLHILDYVRLKGVWNESLYPIIWYYNADIAKEYSLVNCGTESRIFNYSFDHSFRYDETENNPIVKKYFSTRRILSHKKNKGKKVSDTSDLELAVGMYKITSALDKIVNDRNLSPKFQYIESLLENNNARTTRNKPYAQPLELHCAVVCCNVEDRTVLIMRRSSEHATCPEKWEFGCAKATNDEPLISSIEKYYKTAYAIDIELVLDHSRNEEQPVPLAIYESCKNADIRKGVIFAAKVKSKDSYRSYGAHDKREWITEKDIEKYGEDETVSDFQQTLRVVFQRFDELFQKEV